MWQTDRQTDRNLLTIPRLHYMQRGKNSGYIFRIRNELYWFQYRTLGHTAGDRKDSRLLIVDAEHLGMPDQIGMKAFQCGSVEEEPSL